MTDKAMVKTVIQWFEENKRDLPWRHVLDPYAIWVSETLLQQTQVITVLKYYAPFLKTFPTIEALALAKEETVLKAWEGLGYYSRARNLQRGAQYVLEKEEGQLPEDYDHLIQIPGIGPYTANAIRCFAFGKRSAPVDANVVRVMARTHGQPWLSSNPSHRKAITELIETQYLPLIKGDVRPFVEGLIEIGALVCTARNTSCMGCPLHEGVGAVVAEDAKSYISKKKPVEYWTVMFFRDRKTGKIRVEQRPKDGLLANFWQFPMLDGERTQEELLSLFSEYKPSLSYLGKKSHVFTHLKWNLFSFYCEVDAKFSKDERWVDSQDIDSFPFVTAHKSLLQVV